MLLKKAKKNTTPTGGVDGADGVQLNLGEIGWVVNLQFYGGRSPGLWLGTGSNGVVCQLERARASQLVFSFYLSPAED